VNGVPEPTASAPPDAEVDDPSVVLGDD